VSALSHSHPEEESHRESMRLDGPHDEALIRPLSHDALVELYHRPFWMTHEGGFPSPSSSDSILLEGMEDGMAGIAVTRVDPTAAELRRASGKTKVGRDEGCAGGGADAGDRVGAGGRRPGEGSGVLRDGPADAARPGAPLQCRGAGRAGEPESGASPPAAGAGTVGGACRLGGGRS